MVWSREAAVPLLSFALLDELRLRLVEQRAPVVDRLGPGLDDGELDSTLAAIGLRPSRETRIWWAWSSGVPAATVQASADRSVGPGREYLEAIEAVALYREKRELAGEMAADAATVAAAGTDRSSVDWWWQRGWLPITTNGAGTTIACDCSVAEGEPSPIHAVNWGAREKFFEPAASSFGQMVTWWIDALDNGAWRYDLQAGRWHYDWQLVDRERQLSGLV